jgi:hypothetical protein
VTLKYGTGFDLMGNVTDLNQDGWTLSGGGGGGTIAISTSGGRGAGCCAQATRGNGGGNNPIGLIRTFGTQSGQGYIGFAFSAPNATAVTIISIEDSGTVQIDLRLGSDGSLTLTRNGTTIGSAAAGTISFATFHYFEIGFLIASGTGGSVTVKVDQSTVITVAGANTQASGNASWNQVLLGGGAQTVLATFSWDDFYFCDSNGSRNNTHLGDVRIIGNLPNAVGSTTNMTRVGGAASNYQSVNERPTDGDTTYVSNGTVGTLDTYKFASLPANTSQVLAVIGRPVARKDDAGARSITTHARSGGSEADASSSSALTTSYAMYSHIMETNPVTSAAWAPSDVNAAEFGPKVAA